MTPTENTFQGEKNKRNIWVLGAEKTYHPVEKQPVDYPKSEGQSKTSSFLLPKHWLRKSKQHIILQFER